MAVLIESKFNSSCKTCKGVVAKGAPVYWTPGEKGVTHPVCPVDEIYTDPITVDKTLVLGDLTPVEGFETLYDHQVETVNAVKAGHNRLYLGWQPGLGKAQPLDSKVLTPNGFVRMGDISVGDTVLTPQGYPSVVLGVFPQGEEPVYRITLTDGSSTLASGEHLWTVISTVRNRYGTYHNESTLTTNELLERKLQESDGRSRYRVPDISIDGNDSGVTIDPYLLGVLIGDGGMSQDSIRLTSIDQEIFDAVATVLPHGVVLVDTDEGITKRLSGRLGVRNPLISQLRSLGLFGKTSHYKFIPNSYKYASRNTRIELVRGLMDTEGCVSKDNALEFCSVSEALANDFANIVRSLGGYARVAPKSTSWTHKGVRNAGRTYRVTFNCNFNPFRLSRKASVWRPGAQRQRRIKSIEPAGRAETQCIMIDHPDHLYVTDDYIPTHNTAGALAAAEVDNAYPLVIVCPSVVKINWQRETKFWLGKDAQVLQGRTPKPITSDIVIINYEVLSYWQDEIIKLKPRGMVFDESHYIKNPETSRTRAAKKVSAKVKGMILMLSGTPTPNSVFDLVQPLAILGSIKAFGGQRKYVNRYCPPVNTVYGVSHARARNLSELGTNLKNICFIRKTKEECLDLPDKIRVDIPLNVSVDSNNDFYKPLLKQMRKPTMAEAKRVAKTVTNDVKKGQIMRERAQAGTAKVNSIIDMAHDIEEPLVIMVHHKDVQKAIYDKLSKKRKVSLLTGGMTPARRQQAIDDFQNGVVDVIVCSITAAGIGINLQRGQVMILGELPLTYAEVDQAESRCHRSGQENHLTVYRMIALGTSDEVVMGMINKKEAVSAKVEDDVDISSVTPADLIASRLLDLAKEVW